MTARGDVLEVWGDPIAHSRSPQLHAAAYRVLGLPWSYGRRRVPAASFDAELAALGPRLRGLSCTSPLKSAAFAAAATRDRRAELTGAVNTLLLGDDGPRGWNTDVGGLVAALREHGIDELDVARIVGSGATATSALVALRELGAQRIEVCARRPGAAGSLVALGSRLGVEVTVAGIDAPRLDVRVTVATLPGDAEVAPAIADALAGCGGALMDVVYGTWPTTLAQAWQRAGASAMDGLGMLLHQALLQVRVFVSGDADATLPDEAAVLSAMRQAVVGD